MTTALETQLICDHCGEQCQGGIQTQGHHFCCFGCEQVFFILLENDLGDYYRIRESSQEKGRPVSDILENKFEYLNHEQKVIDSLDKKQELYLEGLHCSYFLGEEKSTLGLF